ncbi:MAG: hypothetical protein LKI32_01210 [Lachnospiraceae bacterium]|jgi:hypothetical protein|nr:hypothetical protein [Lachnospiraceae bacterium]MCI1656163.1 hypothetical protein [Lachnospiraceae bacterium]MCI2194645.1 hypothetical protein [Lachnospiraceae bacterium]
MASSKEFRITFAVAMGIALWQALQMILQGDSTDAALPNGVYVFWMGQGTYSAQSSWYGMIFPLLASMAYAGSFFFDIKSGYFRHIQLRVGTKTYFYAKTAILFISGGLVAVLPMGVNLALVAMKYPALLPDHYVDVGPVAKDFGSALYWYHPFAYTVLYLLFDFLLAGMMALLSMMLALFTRFRYSAVLTPFFISFLLMIMDGFFPLSNYVPEYLIFPDMEGLRWWTILTVAAIAAVSVAVTGIKLKNYE